MELFGSLSLSPYLPHHNSYIPLEPLKQLEMVEELEDFWKKLIFTQEEDDNIVLGSDRTKAAKELGDKQKVMDMCPWSYEKNLVLLQDFDSDVAPKDIKLQWCPFWIHIYKLPLKSRTKETGWKIGSKIGEVMDVNVPDNGVQWGRCLRVRVNINITKKLVKGKKITAKDDEQRWVYFRYEQLPNFCYACGKLSHGEKGCKDGDLPTIGKEKPMTQYGAWLRGEPFKRTPNGDIPDPSYQSPEYGKHHRKTEGVQPSHETRVAGEPHANPL